MPSSPLAWARLREALLEPDAAAAVSKAIASTLKRTLPSLTYCMTANPDFSFATTGQVDLVEMFRNLSNKDALNDAVKAGAVHIDLKEFRFDPAGDRDAIPRFERADPVGSA